MVDTAERKSRVNDAKDSLGSRRFNLAAVRERGGEGENAT